jgi:hypothetical protein
MQRLYFSMIVSGPRESGKSFFIRNLLLRKDMLYDVFKAPDYLIIICPNEHCNGDFANLETKKNSYLIENYSE